MIMIKFLTIICLLLTSLSSWSKTIEKHTPVTDILQIKVGKILIATPKGLNGYWNNQLKDLHDQLLGNGITARGISRLALYGSDGSFLVGTDTNGVYLIDNSLNIKRHVLANQKISAIYHIAQDTILVGTNNHLFKVNLETGQQEIIFTGQYVREISQYGDHIYVATSQGLWSSSLSDYRFTPILDKEVWHTIPSHLGIVVFSNPNTYLIKDPGSITRLDSPKDPTFKRGTFINDNKFIVLATDNHELKLKSFPDFTESNHEIARLDQPIIKLYTDFHDHVWIGTTRGLEAFSDLFLKNIPNTKQVKSDRQYVTQHSDGRIFLCGAYNIEVIDQNNLKKSLSIIDPLMISNQIFSCFVDQSNLWIGTSNGLLQVNLDANEAGYFQLNSDFNKDPTINTIQQGPTNNTLLLGTSSQGILLIDKTSPTKIIKQFGQGEINAMALNSGQDELLYVEDQFLVTASLYEDAINQLKISDLYSLTLAMTIANDTAYLGTKGSGVFKIDLTTKNIRQYLEADGLPNNLVTDIGVDSHSRIWTTTRSGLAYLNKDANFFQSMGDDHFFSPGGLITKKNGDWLASGNDGLVIFNPDDLHEHLSSSSSPEVIIDEILKSGEPINKSSELILGPDETGISIITLISDTLASNLTIEYQIPKLNNKWITALNNIINLPSHSQSGEFQINLRIHEYPESIIQIPYTVLESEFSKNTIIFLSASLMAIFLYVLYLYKQRQKTLVDFASTYKKLNSSLLRSQKDKLNIAKTLGDRVYTDISQIRARIRRLKRVRQDTEVSRLLKELDQLRNYIGIVEDEYYPKDLKNTNFTQALRKYVNQYRDSDTRVSIYYDVLSEADNLTELQRLCLYKALSYLIDQCQKLNTSLYINIETHGDRLVTNIYFDVAALDNASFEVFKDHLLTIHHSLIGDDHFLSIEILTDTVDV